MTDSNELAPVSEIVEALTLMDLCRICGLSADWVIELVDEGILEPAQDYQGQDYNGQDRQIWRFESASITVIHKVQRLQADLRLNIPGVAVVLSLADENAALKRQLQLLENHTQLAIWMPYPEK
jgi:chaperone modulatory protein CbpM